MSSFINRDPGMHIVYEIDLPADPRADFTAEEKLLLRPIAETLAMLDGNAFFGSRDNTNGEWYEQYLPEAWELWNSNGGLAGWAGLTSWAQEHRMREHNPAVKEVWQQYQTMVRLSHHEG
jgi:hypothetical protein